MTITRWLVHLACAVLLACSPATAGAQTAPGSDGPPPRKTLLMHYMPWYQTPEVQGRWGGHWTGWQSQHDPTTPNAQGLPDLWSHFHPLMGPYDSADPAAVECHLLQMKLAGVDGVIADWYGISGANDYGSIHRATTVLFDAAGRLGMFFAVCFEDRTVEQLVKQGRITEEGVAGHLTETLGWLDRHWFGAPHYFRIEDRPLVLNFGPIFVKDAAAWSGALGSVTPRPAFFALHHLWESVGADGGFTWVHPDVYRDTPDDATIRARFHETFARPSPDPTRVIVSALPGFKDVYENGYPNIDHREGATLRESLGVAMEGPWPIVQLVTWNDYGEGTVIEPTHEFGYRFLEIIQDATRNEPGRTFRASPDDLRLPSRLLALRRAGSAPSEVLDGIADLLSRGEREGALRALADAESAASRGRP